MIKNKHYNVELTVAKCADRAAEKLGKFLDFFQKNIDNEVSRYMSHRGVRQLMELVYGVLDYCRPRNDFTADNVRANLQADLELLWRKYTWCFNGSDDDGSEGYFERRKQRVQMLLRRIDQLTMLRDSLPTVLAKMLRENRILEKQNRRGHYVVLNPVAPPSPGADDKNNPLTLVGKTQALQL